MFSGCSGLTSLDLSNFDTSNVKTMRRMFLSCSNLTSLDLSSFDTSNLVDVYNIFSNDDKLNKIYVGYLWNVANANADVNQNFKDSEGIMFYGCTSLVGGNGTKYNKQYYGKDYAVIDTKEHPGYLTSAMVNLNIKYYYAYDTNKVVKTDKYEVLRNSEYSYNIEFPNKNYVPDKSKVSGVASDKDSTVKIILNPINDINNTKKADEEEKRYNLNIRYYYEGDNTTVVREDNYDVLELANYNYPITNVPSGYYVNETSVSGTMPSKDLVVNIIYHKEKTEEPDNPPEEKKKYKLTIKYYYEENTSKVVKEDNYDVLEQSKYNYPITNIPSGYYVNETSVSGTMPSKDLVVNVIYHKTKVEEPDNPPVEDKYYTLTIEYYYAYDMKKIVKKDTHDIIEKKNYSYEVKNIPEYYKVDNNVVSGVMPSKNTTVKVVYKPINDINNTNRADEEEKYILLINYTYNNNIVKSETISILGGTDYNIDLKVPESYTADTNNISGTMSFKDEEVNILLKPKAMLLGNNTSNNGELVNPKTGNTKLIVVFIIVISSILLVLKNRKKLDI